MGRTGDMLWASLAPSTLHNGPPPTPCRLENHLFKMASVWLFCAFKKKYFFLCSSVEDFASCCKESCIKIA